MDHPGQSGRSRSAKIFNPWVTRSQSSSTRKSKSSVCLKPWTARRVSLCSDVLGEEERGQGGAGEAEHPPQNASLTLLTLLLCPPSNSSLFVSAATTTQTKSGDDSFHLVFFWGFFWLLLHHPPPLRSPDTHQRLRRIALVIVNVALILNLFFYQSPPESFAPRAAFSVSACGCGPCFTMCLCSPGRPAQGMDLRSWRAGRLGEAEQQELQEEKPGVKRDFDAAHLT